MITDNLEKITRTNFLFSEILIISPTITANFIYDIMFSNFRDLLYYTKITVLVNELPNQDEYSKLTTVPRKYKRRAFMKPEIFIVNSNKSPFATSVCYFKMTNAEQTYSRKYLSINSPSFTEEIKEQQTSMLIDFPRIINNSYLDEYISNLFSCKSIETPLHLELDVNIKLDIILPSISFNDNISPLNSYDTTDYATFDSWLKSGKLCYRYITDSKYGKFSLRLKKPLPHDEIEKLITRSGFDGITNRQNFDYSYLLSSAEHMLLSSSDNIQSNPPRWRALYFTETFYGFWTSAACYQLLGDQFISKGSELRRMMIECIKIQDSDSDWLSAFDLKLMGLINSVPKERRDEYFHLEKNEFASSIYKKQNLAKLEFDRNLAYDSIFKSRFISGYAFNPVPQMGENYEYFALEFCSSIMIQLNRNNSISKFVQALNEYFDKGVPFENEYQLLAFLRKEWKVPRFRNLIMNFYSNNEEY